MGSSTSQSAEGGTKKTQNIMQPTQTTAGVGAVGHLDDGIQMDDEIQMWRTRRLN